MNRLVLLFLLLTVNVVVTPLNADQALEQDRLSQIIRELELVRGLVDRAREEIPRNTGRRISFKYNALADELLRLENAVRRHIDYQNSQPRGHWSLDAELLPHGNGSP